MGMRLAGLLLLAMAVIAAPSAAAEDAAWGAVCVDEDCTNATPLRIVEYFGADWCEPCRPVEAMLDNLTVDGVLVVHHRPSPADAAFSNASHLRFSTHYGLLGLPAIVVDGQALLSGETMAMRLEEALASNAWSLPAGAMANLTTAGWSAAAKAHINTSVHHVTIAASVAGAVEGDVTVVIADPPSNGTLVAALTAPAEASTRPPLPPLAVAGITAGLVVLMAPAVALHVRSMRNNGAPGHDEEG
jgi:hypothetical protein